MHEHADGSVAHYSLRPEEMLRSRTVTHTPSRVLALSTSAFHPMLAAGTAHGELKVANVLRTMKRCQRNHLPVFQQLVDRTTGELIVMATFVARGGESGRTEEVSYCTVASGDGRDCGEVESESGTVQAAAVGGRRPGWLRWILSSLRLRNERGIG